MFNVSRSAQTPASLAAKRSYTEPDVLDALNSIFLGKCYICETKDPLSLNVEHFEAHQGDVDKKFDWNNLFFCCARCNNIKRDSFNSLIDCTDSAIDALRSIKHIAPLTPNPNKIIIQATNDNIKTLETAKLIEKVFNDKNTANKKISLTSLRMRVYKRYAFFFKHVNTYIDQDKLESERQSAFEHLKQMMKKEQEYSAFIRWAVLEDSYLREKLEVYID